MNLPVFVQMPDPIDKSGPFDVIDLKNVPRCRLCPEFGPIDVASGLGLACWRVVMLAPATTKGILAHVPT